MAWDESAGCFASALVLATFCMKTMIPLRLAAIGSSIAIIVIGLGGHLYPVLLFPSALLPMNIWRTIEILRLVRRVETAA